MRTIIQKVKDYLRTFQVMYDPARYIDGTDNTAEESCYCLASDLLDYIDERECYQAASKSYCNFNYEELGADKIVLQSFLGKKGWMLLSHK